MTDETSFRLRPRVALVGISGYGVTHLSELIHLHDNGRVVLTACVAIDAQSHASTVHELTTRGCRVYEDYSDMLLAHAGELELCCLPTPIAYHAPMTVAALEAGANVLVEKPLAATLDDARIITDAAQRAGRFVSVGYQDVYQHENASFKKELLEGRIGKLREIRVLAVRPRPLSYYRRNHWAGRISVQGVPVYDSPINNAFAHFINLACYFAGMSMGAYASPIDVKAHLFRAQPIENFDTALIDCFTDSGIPIKIYATHSCEAEMPLQISIIGDAGIADWTSGISIKISTVAQEEILPLPVPAETRRMMFDQVVSRITDPTAAFCDATSASNQVKLVSLLQTSPTIHQISTPWLQKRVINIEGDEQISILGIESLFHRAFLDGRSFNEMNCPWAAL